jgi:hypothetical protein
VLRFYEDVSEARVGENIYQSVVGTLCPSCGRKIPSPDPEEISVKIYPSPRKHSRLLSRLRRIK